MSDFNSSLPVRTQTNGDVVVKVVDGTTTSQALAVDSSGRVTTKLDDGNGNTITSQANGAQRALDVGINVSGVQVDPRSIRALTSADVVTVDQGTSPWVTSSASLGSASGGTAGTSSDLVGGIYNSSAPTLTTGQQASLQLDVSGNLKVDLATALPAGTATIGSVKLTDGTNTASLTALGEVKASITQPLPSGTNTIGSIASITNALPAGTNLLGAVNLDLGGSPVSNTNPVPVTISTTAPGTAVQDYHTSAALASGSSATFTYTVAASHTFNLERVFASASGKIKAVVQNGATTIFVSFNSTANPNIDITVISPPTVAAAGTVNVVVTNLDLLAQDVYCTIEGNQN